MNYPTFISLVAAAAMVGCGSTTTVDDHRSTTEPIDIGVGERVVILGRRDAGHYETDRSFINCVGNRLDNSNFQVMSEQEFVDAFYPWFEPRTAPKHLKRLKRIMQEPVMQKKVQQEKIRYLVFITFI